MCRSCAGHVQVMCTCRSCAPKKRVLLCCTMNKQLVITQELHTPYIHKHPYIYTHTHPHTHTHTYTPFINTYTYTYTYTHPYIHTHTIIYENGPSIYKCTNSLSICVSFFNSLAGLFSTKVSSFQFLSSMRKQ